ncbi:unknown [Mycoplasma sp. CAG:877]|nr:unknown [Mycoplasma sp. CAG:877]
MKEKIAQLVDEEIKDLNVFVSDAFFENVEGKKIFNIVLDSEEVIDLNRITEASRLINKIIDKNNYLLEDADELDIYSKEKGE